MLNVKLKLFPLSYEWIDHILKENKGNVGKYFISFKNYEEVKTWIDENIQLMNEGKKVEMVVIGEDEEFLGMVSIRGLDSDIVEPGMWIKENAQNKGIAKKAMEMLLENSINLLKGKTMIYDADKDNIPSNKLAKYLGFGYQSDYEEDGIKYIRYSKKF